PTIVSFLICLPSPGVVVAFFPLPRRCHPIFPSPTSPATTLAPPAAAILSFLIYLPLPPLPPKPFSFPPPSPCLPYMPLPSRRRHPTFPYIPPHRVGGTPPPSLPEELPRGPREETLAPPPRPPRLNPLPRRRRGRLRPKTVWRWRQRGGSLPHTVGGLRGAPPSSRRPAVTSAASSPVLGLGTQVPRRELVADLAPCPVSRWWWLARATNLGFPAQIRWMVKVGVGRGGWRP
uniref:Uncharacterized protein n=2 Tax=Aegilops tauschii subsp. strangulata TaxID=200361 RepID=A0A453P6Y3_AEGTS